MAFWHHRRATLHRIAESSPALTQGMAPMIAAAALVVSGCQSGSAGTGPTPPGSSSPFPLGHYTLEVDGFGLSTDPTVPVCTPLGAPPEGTDVGTGVNLTQDGQDWVVQSLDAALGSVDLRFHETASTLTRTSFAGAAQGIALNLDQTFPASTGLQFSFTASPGASPAVVTATIDPGDETIVGSATGSMSFTDTKGIVGSCSYVGFLLDLSPSLPGATSASTRHEENRILVSGPR